MSSIFSTQNLQTFFLRKNFLPPPPESLPPPPPGPRSRSPLGAWGRPDGTETSWFASSAIISSSLPRRGRGLYNVEIQVPYWELSLQNLVDASISAGAKAPVFY